MLELHEMWCDEGDAPKACAWKCADADRRFSENPTEVGSGLSADDLSRLQAGGAPVEELLSSLSESRRPIRDSGTGTDVIEGFWDAFED